MLRVRRLITDYDLQQPWLEDKQLSDDKKFYFGDDKDFSLRYDSVNDQWILRDEVNATEYLFPRNVSMNISAHASRHSYGGADAIPAEGLRFSQLDKVFGTVSSVSIAAGGTYTVPKGVYWLSENSAVNVEFYDGSAWQLAISGKGGVIISDGTNVRLVNTDTANAQTVYLLPIL